jgi:putative endonuclease
MPALAGMTKLPWGTRGVTVIPAQACPELVEGRESRMHDKEPAVYILASQRNGTLYIGVTSDLVKRGWQHRNDAASGFSKRYGVHRLVYFEMHASMEAAIIREKRLKKWNRKWKLELIESGNPEWRDLWPGLLGV